MHISRSLISRTLVVVISAEAALCLGLIAYFTVSGPIHSGAAPHVAHARPHKSKVVTAGKVQYGIPVRLKIAKISVDAALDHVGLTPQGALGVPKGPANAGWYELGPRPGETGSAVIDGHFGYENHIPAVFDNLHTLQKGDSLSVEDDKGALITFVVRELRTYGEHDDATEVFRSADGKAHLNLITCQGVWNEAQKSYANRLVVFADKAM